MKYMLKESFDGGTFYYYDKGFALPAEEQARLLEKWDDANDDDEVADLLAEAEKIASPKSFTKMGYITETGDDYVIINDIRFEGKLVAEKLKELGKVCLYVVSCGRELHDWAEANPDFLLKEVSQDIALSYMRYISGEMHKDVAENVFGGRHFSSLNPGSLNTWDIKGQKPTFELLGEGGARTGVQLTESMLMVPFKSGSGLFFETEHNFESCMYCERLNCPNRRAPFIMNDEEKKDK